ncbi:putative quinol monooxygenase [Haloplanus halobius]|uniref:putative quinol monooxygenase n=1 Tax=Haloplanus halobius TaxID=2934938 RepID=UPI002010B468|nr:putative quinol monooxygenase [Haloplanus sp. XH21]
MLVVHATFPIDPDKREEALDHIRTLAEQSRAEAGTIDYRVGEDVEDPNVFRFLERYEDEEAFAAHTETDHFASFEAALPDLLDGEPEVLRFDVSSSTELDL